MTAAEQIFCTWPIIYYVIVSTMKEVISGGYSDAVCDPLRQVLYHYYNLACKVEKQPIDLDRTG